MVSTSNSTWSLLIQDLSKNDKFYHIEIDPTEKVESIKVMVCFQNPQATVES
jgi:hypothetical protein